MSKTQKTTPTLTREQRQEKARYLARKAEEQRSLERVEKEILTGCQGRGWGR